MNDTSDAWRPYEPSDATPWNRQRVVHLHRRAGFAANWTELERDLADGPHAAIDRLTRRTPESEPAKNFEAMARTIGDAAAASNSPNRLKAWWLYRMLFSPDPLGERLTLMWHNHFATSNRKVQDLELMRQQNELIRENARAPFGQLLAAVVKHPAMLVWLDADANRKGKANENLAREMLELFTLGIGHYTESDVQAGARALTGWAIIDGHFGVRDARHNSESKTFLGTTGPLTGDDLLTIVTQNPAIAQRLAWRICRTFLGETKVGDDALSSLADGIRKRNLDISWAVETVLRSQLFFDGATLKNRVAGPVEWAVGAVKALELLNPPPSTLLLAEWTTRMGQDLFYPPNVGGWSEGRAWLGSQSIVARSNFAAALVAGQLWYPKHETDLRLLVKRHAKTSEVHDSVTWIAELLWGDADHDAVSEIVAAAEPAKPDARLSTAVALLLARPESQLC
jgi:uncharacterized protein (DUF1800 family)